MKFIDTHSHLYSSQFDNDRTEVVKNAIEAGVSTILLPNISSKYTNKMLDLCSEFPKNCFPMIGLHPCDVNEENYQTELAHVEEQLISNQYIAIGEIGLDLYWEKKTLEIQKKAFIEQIILAKNHNLPIVIHVREAFEEAFEIIKEFNDENLSGVFHCFTGAIEDAKKIIQLGDFFLGIGGVLTFKNSGLDQTIKEIDLNHIILETDSPYIAPAPFRGKRNESKYILPIAEKLAQIHNVNIRDIAKKTTENAQNLFKL